MQRLLAIAWLTWKAAFRFRLFPLLAVLLLFVVVGLPLVIEDDGTARGFIQIVLTYTLGGVTALLGFATLWTASGTLARDVEECQMQMVAVKPVARWQIWLGKWLGLVSLNAALLMVAGGAVFALIHWRAEKLPAAQREILERELLVGRNSFKPAKPDIETQVEKEVQARLIQGGTFTSEETTALRAAIREQAVALAQVVPPRLGRRWTVDLGGAKSFLRDQPMQMRVKFSTPEPADAALGKLVKMRWQMGVPGSAQVQRGEGALPPESFHEFPLAPNLFDEHGVLTLICYNLDEQTPMFVSFENGLEVLYRESGFGLNFTRGLAVIWLWLALLAALGLAAASFLSFPVAAFVALSVLGVALSSGLLASVVESGTVFGVDEHGGRKPTTLLDQLTMPAFKALLGVVNLAQSFSPIEALSTGRSITWAVLGLACLQILVVLGGVLALFGIVMFTRRELAAQSAH
ncbi:MAG: hypothetical protein HZA89_07570 [Verrucomicrobia bacterium]|nr:hypothetical protein [Verrucomicrobiota bacterium]